MRRIIIFLLLPTAALASDWEIYGDIDLQNRSFYRTGPSPRQENNEFSAASEITVKNSWNDERSTLTFVPFGRYDTVDKVRTHWDIRQLDITHSTGDWELRGGISKVFWGVTESAHLVDVINQTDFVENIDGEQKMGQPMANVSWVKDFGTFDFFVLPYFRERTHPGEAGRLRFQFTVAEEATYAEAEEENHMDYAFRWSHSIGWFDIGVSHFYGTSREPIYTNIDFVNQRIIPRYTLMHQTGLDVQMTYESWLLKLEAISRNWDEMKDFVSLATGFEYTFSNIKSSGADLGLIVEYLKDSRDQNDPLGNFEATTPFENDLFVGARFALNDEDDLQILGGAIFDLDSRSKFVNIEASRRFGNNFLLTLESRAYFDLDPNEFLAAFRNESYTQAELTYSF